jgi:cytochrome P450
MFSAVQVFAPHSELNFLHRDKAWFEFRKQVTNFCDRAVDEAIIRLKKNEGTSYDTDHLRLVDEAAKMTNDRSTLRSLILSAFSPEHDGAATAMTNAFFHLARILGCIRSQKRSHGV